MSSLITGIEGVEVLTRWPSQPPSTVPDPTATATLTPTATATTAAATAATATATNATATATAAAPTSPTTATTTVTGAAAAASGGQLHPREEARELDGLVSAHAYTVLDVREVGFPQLSSVTGEQRVVRMVKASSLGRPVWLGGTHGSDLVFYVYYS